MAARAFSIAVFAILALQAAACVFQWEFWPLSGHSLYAEALSYRRVTMHRFRATFADGRVEGGVFPEMRAREESDAELATWCARLKARPGFSSIVGTRTRFVKSPVGGIDVVRDEAEQLCGS